MVKHNITLYVFYYNFTLFFLVIISVATYNSLAKNIHRSIGIVRPKVQVVYSGTEGVQIKCYSDTAVTFKFPNGKKIPSSQINRNVLTLNKVKGKDSGNYTCMGTNSGLSFEVTSLLLVGSK